MYNVVGLKDNRITAICGEHSTLSIGDTVMYKGNLECCRSEKEVETYLMGEVVNIIQTQYVCNVGVKITVSDRVGNTRTVIEYYSIKDLWIVRYKNDYGFTVKYI